MEPRLVITALLAHAPEARHELPLADDELLAWLDQRLTAVFEKWSELSLPPQAFGRYLSLHLPPPGANLRAWMAWNVEELYVCAGCLAGDEGFLTLFEQDYIPVVRTTLRRQRLPQELYEDLLQQLRERLLLGDRDGAPALSKFGGLGSLAGWLRVVSAREAHRALESERRYLLMGDDQIGDHLMASAGRGLETLADQRTFREHFQRAVGLALADLAPRDLNLLRLRYVDGATLQQVAAVYRVHHATILRRLVKIQQSVQSAVQQLLMEEMELETREYQSLVDLVYSQLDITMGVLLSGQASSCPGETT